MANPPGINAPPSPSLAPPPLLVCEFLINILIPAGKGHDVVFGSGNVVSEFVARAGGGGFRRRSRMGERRRSTMYGDMPLGGNDFVCSDMNGEREEPDSDVDGVGDGASEPGIGRSTSWVSGSALFSYRDVSYAMVVSNIWRKMIRKSSSRSCSLDGTYAEINVTIKSTT